MGIDTTFLGQKCTDHHKADVALFADIRGGMERLGTINAESQASLDQHINCLFTLLSDMRESINVLVRQIVLRSSSPFALIIWLPILPLFSTLPP